ncbi:Partner of SLD five 1 [Theobroma cacao]|uniref:Partner of SLD five 1 n=1 Tax=Theobroma cacao TaxID=3641 RepID=A0A061GBH3_THECC|nr:Partner of SLD five 1 [Theobroma cacao]
MHGRKAYELVKEFASGEKGHLKIFNVEEGSNVNFWLVLSGCITRQRNLCKRRLNPVLAMSPCSVILHTDESGKFPESRKSSSSGAHCIVVPVIFYTPGMMKCLRGVLFLPFIWNELFERVIEECNEHHNALQSLIRKMQEEGLEVQTARTADHYGALIHHLSLIRNKRCLMAYVYNRAEIIRDLAWKVGLLHELPREIQEKFSDSEEQYFKDHSKSLKLYMSQLSLDVNVDMVPPKDPYIKVRVLEDLGSGIILSDKFANFARHSMHFLKRTDAEQYIARGLMEELTS